MINATNFIPFPLSVDMVNLPGEHFRQRILNISCFNFTPRQLIYKATFESQGSLCEGSDQCGGPHALPLASKIMNIQIGETFSIERTVTDELVRRFAELSGDYNPIHLDEEFAKNTRFGRRIAHGMLSGAFISAVLGFEFRERKIVYLSQTMKFRAPVFIGDTVTVKATVTKIREDKQIVTLETLCIDQDQEILVEGEAAVMILP
jgi:3-hydroxybutyryl-CoA dehydratase